MKGKTRDSSDEKTEIRVDDVPPERSLGASRGSGRKKGGQLHFGGSPAMIKFEKGRDEGSER